MYKLMLMGICMILLPALCGMIYAGSDTKYRSVSFLIPAGTLTMWAVCQLVSVPFILREGSYFQLRVVLWILWILVGAVGILLLWVNRKTFLENTKEVLSEARKLPKWKYGVWILFLGLLLFQLYQTYHLAYADGDDAYYITISNIARSNGMMYRIDAYTGQALGGVEERHCLAPFPVWVAMMADGMRVNTAVAAHSLIPLALIPVTYLILWNIFRILIPGRSSLGLVLFSLIQIFGNTSIYRSSTFLLTRTRQGKEALVNIVIPFLFLLFLMLFRDAADKKKTRGILWILMGVTVTAGCLCSTMGTVLLGAMAGLLGLLGCIFYRRLDWLWKLALCLLPALFYLAVYIKIT